MGKVKFAGYEEINRSTANTILDGICGPVVINVTAKSEESEYVLYLSGDNNDVPQIKESVQKFWTRNGASAFFSIFLSTYVSPTKQVVLEGIEENEALEISP
jgi:hypothetical protein